MSTSRKRSGPGAQQRLAAALRENLKRRKAQERDRERALERSCGAPQMREDHAPAAHDSAGIDADKLKP